MRRPWQCVKRVVLVAAVAGGALGISGCGGPPAGPQTTSFAAAQQATGPSTVEGIPIHASLKRETGKATEFVLREESSANEMKVVAPADVTVPANFSSASYIVVTGTYDPSSRQFTASEVQTKVPNRDQQPRG